MTRDLGSAPLARCLGVWTLVSGLVAGLARMVVPDLLAVTEGAATFDVLLVACAEAALLVAAAWAWAVTAVVTLDAARGRSHGRRGIPATVRRVLLVACGVTLTGSLAVPSYADPGPTGHRDPSSVLQGVPLPERASTALHVARLVVTEARRPGTTPPARPARQRPSDPPPPARSVVVAPGDTLWALAAATLPAGAGDADVAARVLLLHRTNRATVGADPDLILPGQELRLPRP